MVLTKIEKTEFRLKPEKSHACCVVIVSNSKQLSIFHIEKIRFIAKRNWKFYVVQRKYVFNIFYKNNCIWIVTPIKYLQRINLSTSDDHLFVKVCFSDVKIRWSFLLLTIYCDVISELFPRDERFFTRVKINLSTWK